MVALGSALSGNFSQQVRSRGQTLFQYGRVDILSGSAWEVTAQVRGTELYDIHLRLVNNEVHVSCTCPYYQGTGPCKHLWATILQAQLDGLLSGDVALSNMVLIEEIAPEKKNGKGQAGGKKADDSSEYAYGHMPGGRQRSPLPSHRPAPAPAPPDWRRELDELTPSERESESEEWPTGRRLLYLISPPTSYESGSLTVELAQQDRKTNGEWSKPKPHRVRFEMISRLPDPDDREIVSTLIGGRFSYQTSWGQLDSLTRLFSPLAEILLPRMCATGRCGLRLPEEKDWLPIAWDDSGAWKPSFRIRKDKDQCVFEAVLRRGEDSLPLSDTRLLTPGLVISQTHAARLDPGQSLAWLNSLRSKKRLVVPAKEGEELLSHLLEAPDLPAPEVPPDLAYRRAQGKPRPRVLISVMRGYTQKYLIELSFIYEDLVVTRDDRRQGLYDEAHRRWIERDLEAEQAAVDRIEQFNLRFHKPYWDQEPKGWELTKNKRHQVIAELSAENWIVEADGKVFRQPADLRLNVSSGIDWFEVHGEADFGESRAALPELLRALRRGEKSVLLDDGTYGILPDEWLARLEMFAGLGESQEDHYRFRSNQVAILDVLLAEQQHVSADETFEKARARLRGFQGVQAVEQPARMQGHLRDYQREGLGWMQFLQSFGFGGCLADDMGVGKTVQVLALLETRVSAGEKSGSNGSGGKQADRKPSLAVVPRSLIFNWIEEARRFTPQLRLKDYTGIERSAEDFAEHDLILTTYGTLQRDIAQLKDIEFDYVILDEAQAIKNAQTKSAKATRLLKADHRLALSGTPVENHLGELWSLFEFLNPGMLGSSWLGKKTAQVLRNPDEATRGTLAKALRPFILRRTKEQVASELPPKLEQTLYCEVQGAQRRLYNELRDHYRRSLLGTIDKHGLAKSKMHVLEALLRLRQAACHPGLIDPQRASEPSAKLEALLPLLAEVLDEGHKALVFSQFTSLLAIVRRQLDEAGTPYEYLDGQTVDRQACVERFQTDPDCKLFLISLKAGGLGLNLTAAEYVFLLDPWWNPAVEAQAIDRAHRIGQDRAVFAYRLIAKNTVEEKILELQQSKRDLADAVITADNSVLGSLTREDLELLLS